MLNNALGQFARGLMQGFMNEVLRPEGRPPAHTIHVRMPERQAPAGHDFQSLMIAYGEAAGLGMPRFSNRSAGFLVLMGGFPYLVVLTPRNDIVVASAGSRVEFPGGVPPIIQEVIRRQNPRMTNGCQYDVFEDGVCVGTTLALHQLTQSVFEAVLSTLADCMAAFDDTLRDYGYGD
jgi:hypothetical protein